MFISIVPAQRKATDNMCLVIWLFVCFDGQTGGLLF